MSDDKIYFNQCIWQYNDKQISNSFLNVEKFSIQDSWNVTPLKLKFSISPFNSRNGESIYLTHQDVFQLNHKIKQHEKQLSSIFKDVNGDPKKQVNITAKLKKNVIITFLNRVEYGGCCVRLIISDKNDGYLDSEKVYMPTWDFLSLIMILGEFSRSYLSSSDNMMNTMYLKSLNENIQNLNDKVSGYFSEAMQLYKAKCLLASQQARMSGGMTFSASSEPFTPDEISAPSSVMSPSSDEIIKESDDYDIFGDGATDTHNAPVTAIPDNTTAGVEEDDFDYSMKPAEVEIPVSDDNSEEQVLQNQMDDFIKTESPKIDLGIQLEDRVIPDTTEAIIPSSQFTRDVLKNDVTNLEMYVTNLVNDELPFLKLNDIIKSKLNFNPLDGIAQSDINSVNYLISHYLKHSLKKCLEEQVDFPSNVSPMLFSNIKLSKDSLSLMYDLFIYFIYYTQLRNMLKEKDFNPINNRDFMCFSFKTIASPLAISGFNQIDETTLLTEISNRYGHYRESGVFDKLRAEIKSKYSCEFDLPADAMKTEASRIYKAIKANYDKLTIEYSFTKYSMLNLKLNYNDFKENSFQDEQIKKIIAVEFNYRKNGKTVYEEIEYKKFDDIPSSILEKFDIKDKKYDNTNLKRYVKEILKDNEELQKLSLQIVDKVNYSYRDLRNVKVDFTVIPVEILRAIFLWDIDRDEKITINYLHFREIVQKCSLTIDMIISLLTNIQDVIDVNFVNSFIAVRDE